MASLLDGTKLMKANLRCRKILEYDEIGTRSPEILLQMVPEMRNMKSSHSIPRVDPGCFPISILRCCFNTCREGGCAVRTKQDEEGERAISRGHLESELDEVPAPVLTSRRPREVLKQPLRSPNFGVCILKHQSINYIPRFGAWVFLLVSLFIACTTSASSHASGVLETEQEEVPEFVIADGFKVEKVYKVPPEQGSWISLTVDPRGRLIASAQSGLLYCVTLGQPLEGPRVEPIRVFVKDKFGKKVGEPIGSAQGLLWAFDSLYVVINGRAGLGSGLYRVKSSKKDGFLDHADFLAALPGGGEHGPHGVAVDPEGRFLYVTAGNDCGLPKWQRCKFPSTWGGDQLLSPKTQAWGWHSKNGVVPGGWVARTDPAGKKWEIYCAGLRNTYRLAFNPDGELFTCDGDNEWQIGLPWYRAPRICHITGGGDFGWRSGRLKWPTYFPDGLGSVADFPKGGPSSVVMGTGAKFPAKYQRALFTMDWAYGRIYAAHLNPMGSTYSASLELFLSGRPLAIADAVVGKDGALYFVVGGRSLDSELYRITYVGPDSTERISAKVDEVASRARHLRHTMEGLQSPNPRAVEMAWPLLGSEDQRLRSTARAVIEQQASHEWKDRFFKEDHPQRILTAAIALARCGVESDQEKLLQKLEALDWAKLSSVQRLELLRGYSLSIIRMGKPKFETAARLLARLNNFYPAKSSLENRELSRLLVCLGSQDVIERTLDLLEKASSLEDQMHFIWILNFVQVGWSDSQRERYSASVEQVTGHACGREVHDIISEIGDRNPNLASKRPSSDIAEKADAQALAWQSRAVKRWTLKELLPAIKADLKGRSLERGRLVFHSTGCIKCHYHKGEGTEVGPDLTHVGFRLSRGKILESILEPNKVIGDPYSAYTLKFRNGQIKSGRILCHTYGKYQFLADPVKPGEWEDVEMGEVESISKSAVSIMPEGLIGLCDRDEILDLMAYLVSVDESREREILRKLRSIGINEDGDK